MRTPMIIFGVALIATTAACGSTSGPADQGAPATTDSRSAQAQNAVRVQVEKSSLGPILTDQNGRTLYAFLNDKGVASSCVDDCIATWPALVSREPATTGTGASRELLSQTDRAEGTVQATYAGWPLYYYVGDVGPGDVDGQGVDDVWFAVGPDGKLVKTTP
ncbi:COG4315 family predicted lipoprotein [Micromonospora sp. URMC 103]|uniref:COG4315 family predicted lipoprotein n=1 Tax=Micromonospora sp. URMC 103 TaxID=3423406 RepID=UPI003F1ADC8C